MNTYNAIILAGGKGTRLATVVSDCPKPLVKIEEKPFIEWVFTYFREYGIDSFTVSLGHMAEVAMQYFTMRPYDGLNIKPVIEDVPLGTGGAFCFAAEQTDAEILILSNGDSLFLADLKPAFDKLKDERIDGVILGRFMDDASRYGTINYDGSGRITSFAEKRSGAGVINGGVYLLRRRLLRMLPTYTPMSMEIDGIPNMLQLGANLHIVISEAPFIDIGVPETYMCAADFIKKYFKS